MISCAEVKLDAPAEEKSKIAKNSERCRILWLSKYRNEANKVYKVANKIMVLKNKASSSVLRNPLKAWTGSGPNEQLEEQQKLPRQGKEKRDPNTPKKAKPLIAFFLFSKSKNNSTKSTKMAVPINKSSGKNAPI
jgi:hypothetical protein